MRSLIFIHALCLVIAVFLSSKTQATVITIYNTGVDDGGVPLADDDIDPHWTLTGVGAAAAMGPDAIVATEAGGWPVGGGIWLGDNGISAWLVPTNDTYGPSRMDGSAIYTFSTEFTTPGTGQLTLRGGQAADNGVVAFDVDGVPGTFTPIGFNVFADFSITTTVTGTSHTLRFSVQNGAGEADGNGPIGFRAEFSMAEFTYGVPGDVDDDLDVDADDFELIRANFFGIDVGRSLGDLNLDGIVNLHDFGEWKDNYPFPSEGFEARLFGGVPEPGAFV
ncbi:MAG: hypothetical protein JW829_17255, partial [Pirellulales bacterium]|nr:hypothetical protein [Pirellulales bacterium]